MDENKLIDSCNTLNITSRFSTFTNLKENDVLKLNLLKSELEPLVKQAEQKMIEESMRDIFKNLNISENMHRQKRTFSFNSNNGPFNSDQDKKTNIKHKQSKHLRKKNSLKVRNDISASTYIFDIFNEDYFNQRFRNFNKNPKGKNFILRNKELLSDIDNKNHSNYKCSKSILFINEQIYNNKKISKLNNLKNQIFSKEQLNMKSKPGIDLGSLKIINKKLKDKKPIYERYEEIQNQKKAKLEKYNKEIIRTNSAKFLSPSKYDDFYSMNKQLKKEKILNNSHDNKELGNYFEEWLIDNDKWIFKKEKKCLELKKKLEEEKLNYENATYNPQIDQLSDIIANIKNFNEFPGLEVYEKLYNLRTSKVFKQKLILQKIQPTFKPLINNYTPNYLHFEKTNQAKKKKLNAYEEAKTNFNQKSKDIYIKKKQENGKFASGNQYTKKNNDKKDKQFEIHSEKNESLNISDVTTNDKCPLFTLEKEEKTYYHPRIKTKKGNLVKSDITFFEPNQDNKLIFYN